MFGGHKFKNIRVYWLALVSYMGIFLIGYDNGIAGGIVAQPYFEKQFGLVNSNGTINMNEDTIVLSNVVSVMQAGAVFGAFGSAPVSALLGRRRAILLFSIPLFVGAILCTMAGGTHGIGYIYGGRIVTGIGIGGLSAITPTFTSECSPKDVRGRIMGIGQVMTSVGATIAYFVDFGVGLHLSNSDKIWRVPFVLQLVPVGLTCLGLLTVKESPRWLASQGRTEEAISSLAYFRREPHDSHELRREMAEIEAAIQEEQDARKGLGLREAFLGRGNFIRFCIAIVVFLFDQWAGYASVSYYAPQLFASIGFTGTRNSLLASGIYGIVRVVATTISVFLLVDTLGRKLCFFISAMGMGILFFIIGAILKTHPVNGQSGTAMSNPPAASVAMAVLLYIHVSFHSLGWGPLPFVYVSDIFPTRTRHYGLATGAGSLFLFSFAVAKVTPTLIANLGYKMFFMYGTINICGLAVLSILLPETKRRSLEEMDIIFGAVTRESREVFVEKWERALHEFDQTS